MANEKVKKSIFKRWWFWAIIVIIFVVVAVNQQGDSDKTVSTNTDANSSVSKSTPTQVKEKPIVVKAEDLAATFDENEIKGNKLYKDKIAEITGTVSDIGESLGQTYVVLSSGKDFSITNVQCFFKDDNEISKVAEIKKGTKVTIVGQIDGKSINVAVNDCKIK
ncbi:OB-fold putative lipoprotein [Ruminiclostridium cellulolyticum]|uniref:Nucleic acid binding OB-fold tRNA/helicase-type n=1 Tax=Ruminiclostridium cellulolyticum (strain ATCC 35319 / DSM 5812 / JCM 6584 / H10) TaxID=394503 RepID=B8I8Y3_RUMCH|nr:OB-fold putative lipoprotein [Ruminiclostridium cellulolyticum]ACL77315.1 hypothetical protein Ccel_3023 [Ruminiclostridium cellulolyticum H10]